MSIEKQQQGASQKEAAAEKRMQELMRQFAVIFRQASINISQLHVNFGYMVSCNYLCFGVNCEAFMFFIFDFFMVDFNFSFYLKSQNELEFSPPTCPSFFPILFPFDNSTLL